MIKQIVFGSILLATACDTDKSTDTSNVEDIDDTGTTTDTGEWDDTGETEDTGEPDDTGEPEDTNVEIEAPEGFWSDGPELPECTPQEGSGDKTALSGVLLLPTGPEAGVVVVDSSTGLIDCVGDCDTTDIRVVCTEGVISPGLIDGHNHMQYNAIGPWQHEDLYQNRYQWRSDGRYWDYRAAYDSIEGPLGCEIGKWAELRTLVSGGTSVVGSSGGSCISGWVRNLDEPEVAHEIEDYGLYYSASTVTDRWDEDDGERYTNKIADGELGAVMNHVAEGVNGSVSIEIDHMLDIGMAGPGMVFVHSTDASVQHLAKMKAAGTSILWSPRSNLDLYAETTNADIAMRMGIPVALGPDWTWSGSANPARELKCATEYLQTRTDAYFDHLIWEMATVEAAAMVGLEGVLGILYPGAYADIAVFEYDEHPYKHIIEASSAQMKLVLVSGEALYGDTDLMAQFPNNGLCEEVNACSESRTFCIKESVNDDGYDSLETLLDGELSQYTMPPELSYAKELFGVFVCGEPRESCDISIPGNGDDDGDLIDDVDDNCLASYNPKQSDHDSDGVGDACDPCPLIPNETSCAHPMNDVDEDGYDNNVDICPWNHNPDQLDQDGDGKGDACDQCPSYANPGTQGCAYTLSEIRNPADPNHPAEGSQVQISEVVVTANRTDKGFFVQDPNVSEYGGIFIFNPNALSMALGSVVTISGTYTEYYGQSQIKDVTVTTIGSTDVPDPILVADPCTIATGGVDAEKWENTLVQIENVSVSNSNPDDPDNYGEFEVNSCLRIDDLLCDTCWATQPAVGSLYSSITGVLTYTYGHFKVVPRQPSELSQ